MTRVRPSRGRIILNSSMFGLATGTAGFILGDVLQFKGQCFRAEQKIDQQWSILTNKTSKIHLWRSHCKRNPPTDGRPEDPVKRFHYVFVEYPQDPAKDPDMQYCLIVNEARAHYKGWLNQVFFAQRGGLISNPSTLKRWQAKCLNYEKHMKPYDDELGENEVFNRDLEIFKKAEPEHFIVRYIRNRATY